MLKLESLRVDTKRQEEGEWVEIPDWPGTALRVRGLRYQPYVAALSVLRSRWVRKFGAIERVPDEEAARDLGRLYARHLLLEWRGVDEPFERAEEFLADPAFPDLRNAVSYAAALVAQTEAEFIEDAAKNSRPSSAGGSKTAA